MKKAVVKLSSSAPYSQSRFHDTPKLPKELSKDHEERTWKNRLHINEDGNVIIPPTCFKNCLSEAAKFLSIQIPGKGKSTYTKHFEAGVLVVQPSDLKIKAEKVTGEWFFVPADGKRGSGKRVMKCFPCIPKWDTTVEFLILDETITEDVFVQHLEQAGQFIGVGRFRPRNNGFYGRFKIDSIKWE